MLAPPLLDLCGERIHVLKKAVSKPTMASTAPANASNTNTRTGRSSPTIPDGANGAETGTTLVLAQKCATNIFTKLIVSTMRSESYVEATTMSRIDIIGLQQIAISGSTAGWTFIPNPE